MRYPVTNVPTGGSAPTSSTSEAGSPISSSASRNAVVRRSSSGSSWRPPGNEISPAWRRRSARRSVNTAVSGSPCSGTRTAASLVPGASIAAASSGVRRYCLTRLLSRRGARPPDHRLPERLHGRRRPGRPGRRRDRAPGGRTAELRRLRPRRRHARLAPLQPRLVQGAGRAMAATLRARHLRCRAARVAPEGRGRRGSERRLRAPSRGLLGVRGDEPRVGPARARDRRGDRGRPRHGLLREAHGGRCARPGLPRDDRPRRDPRHRRGAGGLRARAPGVAGRRRERDLIMWDRLLGGMRQWLRMVGRASPGSRVIERDGVTAAVVPVAAERAVVNSLMYDEAAGLAAAYDEVADAYEEIGAVWTVWAPSTDEGARAALHRAGHVLDAAPAVMAVDLKEIERPPAGALEDWTAD